MKLIDNINHFLGDDLKQTVQPNSRLKITAACFSIYAQEALKIEFEKIKQFNFIFTSPTFVVTEVTGKVRLASCVIVLVLASPLP